LKISHFHGASETAVRIQITVAPIAFMLLRLARDANRIGKSAPTLRKADPNKPDGTLRDRGVPTNQATIEPGPSRMRVLPK
jgi:hypothetical protein